MIFFFLYPLSRFPGVNFQPADFTANYSLLVVKVSKINLTALQEDPEEFSGRQEEKKEQALDVDSLPPSSEADFGRIIMLPSVRITRRAVGV